MHFVFYRTIDVFAAEENLQNQGIKTEIVPTPVQDKAYCGVCIFVQNESVAQAVEYLTRFDYKQVH